MFLERAPGFIVAACLATYIRETQPPVPAEGPSIGQAAFTPDEHAYAPVRAHGGVPVLTMGPVSDGDPAAVDREHDTVSECRLRRGQVNDGCGDLLRGAQSPSRCERGQVSLRFAHALGALGADRPRGDGVDADALGPELRRPCLG